jgi:hypothetical protein
LIGECLKPKWKKSMAVSLRAEAKSEEETEAEEGHPAVTSQEVDVTKP